MSGRLSFLDLFFLACFPQIYLSENIALGKPTAQSSVYATLVSSLAVNGNPNRNFQCSCTDSTDKYPWWTVDLQDDYYIHQVVIYDRGVGSSRLHNVYVEGFLLDPFMCTNGVLCVFNPGPSGHIVTLNCTKETRARYIRLRRNGEIYLTLCEVEIYGEIASDQGTRATCSQKRVEKIAGQKLTPSVDLGSASNRLDCLHLCQRRPSCNIFNYNSVTKACSTSDGVSLIDNDNTVSSEHWDLYPLC